MQAILAISILGAGIRWQVTRLTLPLPSHVNRLKPKMLFISASGKIFLFFKQAQRRPFFWEKLGEKNIKKLVTKLSRFPSMRWTRRSIGDKLPMGSDSEGANCADATWNKGTPSKCTDANSISPTEKTRVLGCPRENREPGEVKRDCAEVGIPLKAIAAKTNKKASKKAYKLALFINLDRGSCIERIFDSFRAIWLKSLGS